MTERDCPGHRLYRIRQCFVRHGPGTRRQANKLSRTHATLLEALNRHRGKGQQRVTVEHVHVYEGGQAIVGHVEGGGVRTKSENQPHALGYAPGQTLWSENTEREAVPVAGDAERQMQDARWPLARSAEGQSERL
jgi:hypothetical protein